MTLLTEPTRIVLAKGQPFPNDPYFAFNSLLLHGNGTNGSTVITDSSGSPKTVTAVGDAQISTAQSKFGGSSIAFDGSGDYLSTTAGSIRQAVDPFTIESWAWITTRTNFVLLSSLTNLFYLQEVGGTVYFGDNSSNPIQFSAALLPLNSWFHLAISFNGATYRIYLDGAQVGTTNLLLNSVVLDGVRIGNKGGANITGYLDDLRITKGVARYTSNFTPPTLPFPDF